MKTLHLFNNVSKLAILSVTAVIISSCNSAGAGSSAAPPVSVAPPPPPPVASFGVTGVVDGLDGEVVLVVNGESITQDADGAFEFSDVVISGEDITISFTSDPFGQSCEVTGASTFTNVTSDVTGIAVDCIDVPIVNVSVRDFFTGADVASAEVTLSRQDDEAMVSELAVVNDAGVAAFEVPLSSERLSFSTDPVGFGAQTIIVDTTDTAETVIADIFVQAADVTMTFSNATGGDIMVGDDALVTLPANGFVDAAGAQVSGDISLELTVIDPSQSSALMPGDFQAQDPATSEVTQIESFGALDLTFMDSSGNPVQLASDSTATLRIPVATRVEGDAPVSIPLYFFDETTGFWVEEGSANLVTLASGEQVYEGSVAHFTTWNADRRSETVTATGCVVDVDGQPLGGVRLTSEGESYIGSSRATSDAQGVFTIDVRIGSVQRVTAFRGSQSQTVSVTSASDDFTFADAADPTSCLVVGNAVVGTNSAAITLTWGANPSDLDAHFFGIPTVETETSVPFEVSFVDEVVTVNNQTISLDFDDTSGFGPEIIAVPSFPYEGIYTYGVDLFGGSGTIASSPARVEINLDGTVSVFGPPDGEPTRCWAVARFIVDSEGNVVTETIGTWEDRNYCRDGVGIAGTETQAQQKTSFTPSNSQNTKTSSGYDAK